MSDGLTRLSKAALPYLEDVAVVAALLARRGWAEANAGNISIRVEGNGLLVKRAGVRMRDLARAPLAGLCLVANLPGVSGRTYSVFPADATPTSELPTHVSGQRVLKRVRPECRAMVHAHPTALISLSLRLGDPRRLVSRLLSMHTEAPLLLQDRLTAIPFLLPGSSALGSATAQALERFLAVIWPGHGMVAVGPTTVAALDLIELTEKMAEIALNLGASAGLSLARRQSIRMAFGRK